MAPRRRMLPLGTSLLAALLCCWACGRPAAPPPTSRVPGPTRPIPASPRPAPSVGAWEPAGFGGAGNFTGVYFDPAQPGLVYATSDVAGVFRSSDSGNHWEMLNGGLGNYEVSSFAVDPFDSHTLYAGTGAIAESDKAGIYVSHDAGVTWEHLSSTFANRITFRRFRTAAAIAPDPAQQGVLLSGSRENGIWRSTDGGLSWSQVYESPLIDTPLWNEGAVEDDPALPCPAPVSIVLFDPADPTVVYAGLDGFGVVRSAQGGASGSWQLASDGLPADAPLKYLAVGPGGVLYAAVGPAGVYRSTNGGDSWQPANGSLPLPGNWDAWVSSVAVHPGDPDVAYLTLTTYDEASVWKSTDGGATWVGKGDVSYDPINDPTEGWLAGPTLSWQVAIDPHQPDRLFFVNYWDILRSEDGGEHWQTRIAGAQNSCVTSLAVDADHPAGEPDVLYATHMDAGLLASSDGGATWQAVLPTSYDEALAGHYWRFTIARSGGTKAYYTTGDPWATDYGQVLRSGDGLNWTVVLQQERPAGTWMGGGMLGLAVDPGRPGTLYVAQDGGQVLKSEDGGDHWAPTAGQPGDDSFTYALAVDEAGRVFAGTLRGGLWRSADGGDSWEQVMSEQSTIFHLLAAPGALYASAGDANLYRSSDGGDSWQALTDFAAPDDGDGVGDQGMAIAVDPGNPNHLFFSRMDTWHAADAGPGLVESTDGGATWAPASAGLGHLKVSALVGSADGTLFAGTWCGGVWRRPAATAGSLSFPPTPQGSTTLPAGLAAVDDFLYQLQNLDLAAIGETAYDLVVTDYSADGSADGEFGAAQIAALKGSPGGPKIVLAYMSIGEAESYRFYWQDGWRPGNPPWLGVENPDWPGNYKVHYWDPAW